ncbi:integration host factor, actinobacterial type [Pseudarthrobacter sp. J1763]|uniref:integration host factor, actinobacterial type n=1 Tax=Pseudarthrobacter sp. J1763 TaxID=3420445 RepID=UPI003D28F610
MSLRALTTEERLEALKTAAEARAARARVKEQLKAGSVSITELITAAESDPALARMRVNELLEALPGVGKIRAAAIMEDLNIAASRRIRGLGIHQRQALVNFIDHK